MEARENSFDFIRNENKVIIPFFQRAYVWEEKHWEQLLFDLKNSFIEKKEHFLGSIILKRHQGTENYSLIIDGQQRLTTFSILIKVLYDYLENSKKQHFKDYLFEKYTDDKPKINHSRLDKEKYEKVLKDEKNDSKAEKGIFGCFNYFKKEIENLKQEIDIFEFIKFIIDSKLWVIVCLNANEDEQKIFDSINSTGERLSATDIVKNALFDRFIKISDENKASENYKKYWQDIFEKDEKIQNFWMKEIETGRLKRTQSEILLQAFAIIKNIFDVNKHNLSMLSSLYKEYIKNFEEDKIIELLKDLAQYATLYKEFPELHKETIFYYEEYEKRFFHLISFYGFNSSILPLVLFLKYKLKNEDKIYKECLYLLEILIMCNFNTKDYNKFFVRIINKLKNIDFNQYFKILQNEIYKEYFSEISTKELEKWLNYIENKDAKFILFWIELFREYKNKDYKDKTGLQFVYTLEHLCPQKWEDFWSDIIKNEDEANELIYQIGNMTLLKGKLNTSIKNNSWQIKLNGNKKVKNYINKNADLLINKELITKKVWNKEEIKNRTQELIKDFFEIWNIDIFTKEFK